MKELIFGNNLIIRHESELAAHFRDFIQEDPDLHWTPESQAKTARDGQLNHLELEFDGKRFGYLPFYQLKPSLPWLESIKVSPPSLRPLVITPELSPRILNACKELGIAAIDLNGRTWLRAPGLLVDRLPLPGRSFSYEIEPRNIFVGKSARIIRCLLTDRDRTWTQSEIIPRIKVSSGLVSRIVQHLISQGYAEKVTAWQFRLSDWQGLLDEWVDSDRFPKRTRTTLYAGFLGSPQELSQNLQQWARDEKVPFALTQWIAAWVRHSYTEPVICSAYVARLPDASTLKTLGLRPVTEGGKLWLHIPDDEGVLNEIQTCKDLTLVTDAQIYLDLQRTGLRGPDAAAALREWKGFCLP